MPLNKKIKKTLVIGSGPIVIGQAAEFDYAGIQALSILKQEGIKVVLINSNPATIMTDKTMADQIYIEPLNLEVVKRIIEKEKPDSILSGFGGQTSLNLCMELAKGGFLKKHKITLLGASPETIDKAEDRQLFKDAMLEANQPCIPSSVETTMEGALRTAKKLGYPIVIRPAFTLGGSGGGIVKNIEQMNIVAKTGLETSPIHQILVEKCISGWKEIEFEVMRDNKGNAIIVCDMENFDPVGVHTGDSIVVAPCMTITRPQYIMLRQAAFDIIKVLDMKGGCNIQFALNPVNSEYAVIEVNPRVSRSSALASKATGYPIAKIATKIALGYNLDEINITKKVSAAFEPKVNYVVVKMPKWPFDKFVYAQKKLGTQMKSTGEVMSIGTTFEEALMKAVRGLDIKTATLNLVQCQKLSQSELDEIIENPTDCRLFAIYESMKRKISLKRINELSKIDLWFLSKVKNICDYELKITNETINQKVYKEGKLLGFTDYSIKLFAKLGRSVKRIKPSFKMIDTCATTPYYYASYQEGSIKPLSINKKKTIIVIGSGCIRIGQGIEFDYASVHCVWTLRKLGYNVVIINNNPETVSTDYDVSDRLYFEPLWSEDVLNIIDVEKPIGVMIAFGGQTGLKLANYLAENKIPVIGTSAESIDLAENRNKFDTLLEKIGIVRPKGQTVTNKKDALIVANKIQYPILIRPSYVLGGQNMVIAFNDDDVKEFMEIISATQNDSPILLDKYIHGFEYEIDAIYDGENILIPGIMEHVERAGIHSGDSIAVYPPRHLSFVMSRKIIDTSIKLCKTLKVKGSVNIQYIVYGNELHVIEVNPRSSRTVPYLSKITQIPIIELATKVSLGQKITDFKYGTDLYPCMPFYAVKVPVFSFEKLTDVDPHLGAEMKSTGEVLGIGSTFEEAIYKGLLGAGYTLQKTGGVIFSVCEHDKNEITDLAKKFEKLNFTIYATKGNAQLLSESGVKVQPINKISECPTNNMLTLLNEKKVNYIISTSTKGRNPNRDSVKFRRKAIMLRIPILTSIDTANALVDSLLEKHNPSNIELVDANRISEFN